MENTTPPLDHYAALRVSPTATEAEIVKAAKKRRIETHPDKYAGKSLTRKEIDAITYRAQCVGLAADILCDVTARSEYDRELARWKSWQKSQPRPAEPPLKESARTRHATPTSSSKPDHRHDTTPNRVPSQSSRRGEKVIMSDLLRRAAEAEKATHAPRPSASDRPRTNASRQDRGSVRQDRDSSLRDQAPEQGARSTRKFCRHGVEKRVRFMSEWV